jgi:hypothetical protein
METIMARLHNTATEHVATRRKRLGKEKKRGKSRIPDNTVQHIVLIGFAGLGVTLLLAFTIYGFCRQPEMLKDLLSITKFFASVILLWAVGPQVWSRLLGKAQALSKRTRNKDGRKQVS